MEKISLLWLWCTLVTCPADDVKKDKGNASAPKPTPIPTLPIPPLTRTHQKWEQDREWTGETTPPKEKGQVWANLPFDKSTLLEVKLAKGLHNPWGYGNQGGRLHAVYTHDHSFPVVLPPRYLENGYEWRAYESFNLGENSLFWVGVPSDKRADYVYEVADDGKYHIKINIFPKDNPNAPLYEQRLVLEEVSEHIIVNPNNYDDELNGVFANMADEKATEWGGGRYHFHSPSLSSLHPNIQPSELTLNAGCAWTKSDRQDVYQWGKARINWHGRELKHAKTFCSDKLVAVAYLLERDEVERGGMSKRVIDERLLVNVFDKETLTPFDGVYLETYIDHDIKDGLVAGTIDIKEIKVAKVGDELQVVAVLNNGKTVRYR